ncbi:maleylacetate reductase and hydroxyquinol 1,2-dioxygenase domain-containing protein [Kutzneria viridogrisea]|nr:maleylacetate reductase and hydroxyquinol 1,2-dioxygenase domain-containing protein [Kutzneria albida]MBA8924041.1 alcohol dehydrogenase class IV/protocatechuate 3,4-dioxygenase beta subunit [Kutzneria viridogrisea]
MRSFAWSGSPARIVFGAGTLAQVPEELARLGSTRPLLLASDRWADCGVPAAARFGGATMHTPVEVTEQALAVFREHGADSIVAIGGGSTTGLSKALAAHTAAPQIVVPTTYAGSEVTPVLGETRDGVKTTRRLPEVLPGTVVYDVELTRSLPVATTVTSAVNALAHAIEALYSPQASPMTDAMALHVIGTIPRALRDLSTVDSRAELLEAAWLAGNCLASVSTGRHHKLCHELGGRYRLPHSETHTVLLPHSLAAHGSTDTVARAMGVTDAPGALYDLISELGGPTSLRELGMPEPQDEFLHRAWRGQRPGEAVSALTRQVLASFAGTEDPRTHQLITDLVRHLHSYAVRNDLTEREWTRAIEFLTDTGHITDDKRQEFVLLSDVLGLSSVVDLLTNSRTPDTTPSAVLGPFYVDGPPAAEHGADISDGLPGTPLVVRARVTDEAGEPVPGAVVDVWQSNEDGFYDVQLPELDGPVLRARFHTDPLGRLHFRSILPSAYPIPADGPVGGLLAEVGRHPYRAPHVHFMISAPGHRRLVTQLFVRGGEYLDSDTVFGVKDALVVEFTPQPDGSRLLDYEFRIGRLSS